MCPCNRFQYAKIRQWIEQIHGNSEQMKETIQEFSQTFQRSPNIGEFTGRSVRHDDWFDCISNWMISTALPASVEKSRMENMSLSQKVSTNWVRSRSPGDSIGLFRRRFIHKWKSSKSIYPSKVTQQFWLESNVCISIQSEKSFSAYGRITNVCYWSTKNVWRRRWHVKR